MSYAEPIDVEIVQQVIDDLEDNNAHTICDLLRAQYGLPGDIPVGQAEKAYRAAQWVFESWRIERWKESKNV